MRRVVGIKSKVLRVEGYRSIDHKGLGEATVFLGMCGLGEPSENSAYINDIKVFEKGKGTGSQLLNELEGRLRTEGIRKVYVHATPRSAGFWRKRGYKPTRNQPIMGEQLKMCKGL